MHRSSAYFSMLGRWNDRQRKGTVKGHQMYLNRSRFQVNKTLTVIPYRLSLAIRSSKSRTCASPCPFFFFFTKWLV